MKLKAWFLETRPQFLLLSIVLSFLGVSMAWYDGFFNFGYALLATLGLLLAHISVNVLNDYCDYVSGVDLAARRTPFSGGSGILPAAMLRPKQVLWFGIITLLLAAVIGIYFVLVTGWWLLPLLLVGGLCIVLYTPVILKRRWPEWSPGVGLGALPVLGTYFVQAGEYTWPVLIASIPSGILVHNLLFLNEFPDVEADSTVSRKTMPITMGKEKASRLYGAITVAVYLWIIAWVIVDLFLPGIGMPVYALIALLTLPLAIKAIRGARQYEDMKQLVGAMAANVMVVLLLQLLLGVGYILAGVF